MSFFRFFRRRKPAPQSVPVPSPTTPDISETVASHYSAIQIETRRYFHNQQNFQCFTSWFSHWDGWISAGHCVTEAHDHVPDFADGQDITKWPDGLDAALAGCTLPASRPSDPIIGRDVVILGYPAGSRHIERRTGRIYFERSPGQWIVHIFKPDEPVVTGMSGGPVIDAETGVPIGITITRNSPADLNNDRDPDESADFIALSSVWDALNNPASV